MRPRIASKERPLTLSRSTSKIWDPICVDHREICIKTKLVHVQKPEIGADAAARHHVRSKYMRGK